MAKTASARKAKASAKKPTHLSAEHEEILDRAKRQFAVGNSADTNQRVRELDDLAFYAGGKEQWTTDQQAARAGQAQKGNLPPLPARPMITINKVRQPVQQVTNQIRQSDFGVELAAADDFGELAPSDPQNAQEIELREGLVRRIQRTSEASDARLWAASRAAIAGRGYYAVLTRFSPTNAKSKASRSMWEKEIYVHRFYNQASVLLDPNHEQPDGSDVEWEFIGVDLPWENYKAQYKEFVDAKGERRANTVIDTDAGAFRALGDEAPGWFTLDKEIRTVRVVDYLWAEYTSRTLCLLKSGAAAWKDQIGDGEEIADSRDVTQRTVRWVKLDGYQVLEEIEWESPEFPIVKVLGEELQPFDSEHRAEGMVRPSRDGQVGYNVMCSKLVETIGLTPIPPLVLDPESIESYQQWYQLASTRTLPYLPARTRDDGGLEYRPPTAPQTARPDVIQALSVSLQMFDEAIQTTTGVPDSRVGKNTDAHLKSGKAIQALQAQSEQGTSNYADNLKRSVRREGIIENSLLYPIYGKTPGRLVSFVDGQGAPQTGQIAAPGQPPPQTQQGAKPPKQYTLTEDANFNVVVKVTKSFDSRREEESSTIAGLLDANPMFMTWFGDLFFDNQDGPGHAAMAERAKVMLDPKIQQMLETKAQGADVPPTVAAKMAAQDQQIKHAEAAMQQLNQQLQKEKSGNASKERIAKLDNDTKVDIATKDRAARVAIARIAAAKEALNAEAEDAEERLALGIDVTNQADARTHEAAMEAAGAAHAADMADKTHAHSLEAAAAGVAGQAALSSQGHEQTLEQGQQAADLAPEPAAPAGGGE